MDGRKRIEYLAVPLCVFVTGFLVYGLIGSLQLLEQGKLASFFLFGDIGGFGFSMLLSTVMLTARFFAKRFLQYKIVAAVLWPVIFGCAVYAGVFSYFPYQLYNIVKIIQANPNRIQK